MKRFFCIVMLALLLAGCSDSAGKQETAAAQNTPKGTPVEALDAYETVLKRYYEEHINAAGEQIWVDSSFGGLDENRFAVMDVDGDSTDELLFEFTTAPTAGMVTYVYGWDFDSKAVIEKLSVYPNLTWYTDGLMEAGWSHNQGLAGDSLWPYTLMRYDAESKTFKVLAQVDAWDRTISEQDYSGKDFPAESDTDKTGVVYLVTKANDSGEFVTETMSKSAYETWHDSVLGNAKIQPVSYLNTTLDNINTISPN